MYQTNNYLCQECGHTATILVAKEERDFPQECPECGGEATRSIFANVTRVSYVDGTNRWKSVREMRNIDKEIRRLKRGRERGIIEADVQESETKRLKEERQQIQKKGRTQKAEIAPKGER